MIKHRVLSIKSRFLQLLTLRKLLGGFSGLRQPCTPGGSSFLRPMVYSSSLSHVSCLKRKTFMGGGVSTSKQTTQCLNVSQMTLSELHWGDNSPNTCAYFSKNETWHESTCLAVPVQDCPPLMGAGLSQRRVRCLFIVDPQLLQGPQQLQ